MFLRDSFKPTPSRFAFEPDSLVEVMTSLHHIERELRGYWWSGTPKRRVLWHGTFRFAWDAIDDRLEAYQDLDYRKALLIANNATGVNRNIRCCDYSITQTPGASYEVGALNILQPGWDATALQEFLDSITGRSMKPGPALDHPRGTDGWYSNAGAFLKIPAEVVEQDLKRLFRYEEFKAELDAQLAANLVANLVVR